jgi:ketosteroid isomerase-like protein
MRTQENVQIVKDFFAALGSGDKRGLLALVAKTDERPGVYRHASTGAGLRDGREPQALTHGEKPAK